MTIEKKFKAAQEEIAANMSQYIVCDDGALVEVLGANDPKSFMIGVEIFPVCPFMPFPRVRYTQIGAF